MYYLKNGKECLLCHTRKKLIRVTPEEKVRQSYILQLINDYGVPKEYIESEVPMSYFGKGYKGRADIIVYEYNENEDLNYPLILVECKAPEVFLTDTVFQQACNYNNIIGAILIVLTNGVSNVYAIWDDSAKEYIELADMPSYSDLLSNKNFDKKHYTQRKRPNYFDSNHKLIEEGIIGEDTNKNLHPFLINLYGLISDEEATLPDLSFVNYKFLGDGGLRFTAFGNSAGGSFTGEYRYFIIEDENKDTQIVSISVMGKLSSKDHPRFGNSKGYTLLLVAIDDYEQSHLSLELAIDRFTNQTDNKYEIYHDGTLTVGNRGRVKNSEVIEFVLIHKPYLIRNNKVYLGTLDNSELFTWQRKDVLDFFKNVVEYAIVRDQFRKVKKQSL